MKTVQRGSSDLKNFSTRSFSAIFFAYNLTLNASYRFAYHARIHHGAERLSNICWKPNRPREVAREQRIEEYSKREL